MSRFTQTLMTFATGGFLLTGGFAPADAPIDEKAAEALRQIHLHIQESPSFRTHVTGNMNVNGQERVLKLTITSAEPNRYRAEHRTDENELVELRVADGAAFNQYINFLDAYQSDPQPGDSFTHLFAEFRRGDTLVEYLIEEEGLAALAGNHTAITFIGDEETGEGTLTRLGLESPFFESELTLRLGENPRFVSLQVADKNRPMVWDYTFDSWETGLELAEDTFAFNPPTGAREVVSLQAALQEEIARQMGQPSRKPLLGETAPDFSLPTLDGETVSLQQHRDKDIVILDFWASWCGPCREAMPILATVADDYKDRNVVLYAVNLRESEAVIRSFTDRLDAPPFTVALDKDSSVGAKYRVNAIPHSVIVGKDGSIQSVHIGLAPDLDRMVRKELDILLRGDHLVQTGGAGQ